MNATNPYAPPRAEVRDFEEPLVGAGRGVRLGAAMLDGVIGMAMIYVPALVAFAMVGGFDAASAQNPEAIGTAGLVAVVAGLVGAIPFFGLTLYFVLKNSQTIAKKICGIKVVRKDGSPCSFARIFWLRNVVNLLLGVVPFYSLIDSLLIFGEDRQCLHDKLADTIVIQA